MNFNNQFVYKILLCLLHWKKGGVSYNYLILVEQVLILTDLDPEGLIRNGDYRIDNGLFAGNARTPFVEDAHHI
jgi:hypothetical protein